MYFHFFVTYLSLEKDGAFYLNKLESHLSNWRLLCTRFGWSWPTDSGADLRFRAYCVFLCLSFRCFVMILLRKGRGPSFEQTWIYFTQGCFVPSFVENGLLVLEKKKMWKVYDNYADDANDDDEQQTNFDQKSSLENLKRE